MPTAGEVMHRGLLGCGPDATLASVAALLVEHRIHVPFGILSTADVLAKMVAPGSPWP